MSISSFIGKFSGEALFDKKTTEFLDSKMADDLSNILNDAQFPVKYRKQKDLEEFLFQKFEDNVVKKIMQLLSVFLFFIRVTDDYAELKKMFNDTLYDSKLSEDKKKALESFFNSLKHIESVYNDIRLKNYKTRANNYYKRMSYSCSVMGRFKKDYNYEDMQIESYTPVILDTIPIVSLRFNIEDGENDNVISFTADESALDKIISTLLAAQKELKLLKTNIKREK